MKKLEQIFIRLIEFGLLTEEEELEIEKDLLETETRLVPRTQFIDFFNEYNKLRGTKYLPDLESRRLFYETEAVYSNEERLKAVKNALTDKWVIEQQHPVNPKWILKSENIAKYLNYAATNSRANATTGTKIKRESVA